MPHVLHAGKNIVHRRTPPAVGVFKLAVSTVAHVFCSKVGRRTKHLFLGQNIRDLIHALAVNDHAEDVAHNGGSFLVDNPALLVLRVFQIPVDGMISVCILCARAYYVLFEWEQYKDNLLSVFQINKGELAIYGCILGGVAVVLIYCKVKELSFWSFADTLIPSLVLGQAIGRWGNFVNQEAYGNLITNPDLQFFPYGVYIEELGQWHQATFFYESALNTLLLIVMLISYPHFRKKGYLLPFYMIGYGVIRCFVEGLRTDSLYLMPGVRVSQVLSGCLILLGVLLVDIIRRRKDIQA